MSNEPMTDARALSEIDGYVPRHCRAAIEHIAARLRGEAVQGEQQAVACTHDYRKTADDRLPSSWIDVCALCGHERGTRPQPVATTITISTNWPGVKSRLWMVCTWAAMT